MHFSRRFFKDHRFFNNHRFFKDQRFSYSWIWLQAIFNAELRVVLETIDFLLSNIKYSYVSYRLGATFENNLHNWTEIAVPLSVLFCIKGDSFGMFFGPFYFMFEDYFMEILIATKL